MTTDLAAKASALLALHQPGTPAVLPTVWDAWSARLAASAGFQGLTVGSHPLADSLGREDGEGMTFDEVLTRVAQITASVDIPVSVDIESGYGLNPATLIGGLLQAGAVGLNIEDTVHSEGGRLRSADEHAELIGRLRQAADAAGVEFVINARTDLFKNKDGDDATRVGRAIDRLKLCAGAGARVGYPVGFHDEATWTRLTSEIPLPLNGIANPAEGELGFFAKVNVARVSFGPILQMNLAKTAGDLLARWK